VNPPDIGGMGNENIFAILAAYVLQAIVGVIMIGSAGVIAYAVIASLL
jgi:hypothetical protein